MRQSIHVLAICLATFACKSSHATDAALKAHGLGLQSYDREAPAGTETYAAPNWKPGDRFVFTKGGKLRVGFTVAAREGGGFELVEDETGTALELDADFGELGEKERGASELHVVNDPVDSRFVWPLWVGKRWTSNFVVRADQEKPVPLIAHYRIDALEEIAVPAGKFRCLRMWRTVQLAMQGNYIDRVAILWYAPEAGIVVKRLDDGVVTELADVQHQ